MFKSFKESFFKAVLITLAFAIVHQLYHIEIIRDNIEDIGFDITSKLIFENKEQDTNSPKVMLFGYDDLFLQQNNLFDKNNMTNYGYLFPRSFIASFISDLDELCEEVEKENTPKALFIDYDFSFTSLPFGKELSKEDKQLLEVLKQNRPYKILLPKNGTYNFIEQSKDKNIQKLIKEKKIIFVSVKVLKSSDGIARRYLSYKNYENKTYPNVNIALWQIYHKNLIDIKSMQNNFKEKDIIANRVFLKGYKKEYEEEGCKTSYSYWNNYTKYSAACSPFDIVEEDYKDSIILLGGTYSANSDEFQVLDVSDAKDIKGIELHANTIMSLFYLDGQLKQIEFIDSILLVLVVFFMVDLLVGFLFSFKMLDNKKLHLLITFILMTTILIVVSVYLLEKKGIWFNWFIPIILFEIYDVVSYLRMKVDKFKQRKVNEKIVNN